MGGNFCEFNGMNRGLTCHSIPFHVLKYAAAWIVQRMIKKQNGINHNTAGDDRICLHLNIIMLSGICRRLIRFKQCFNLVFPLGVNL